MSAGAAGGLGSGRVVWLVTSREFLARARSKVFLISTVLLVLGVVGGSVAGKLLGGTSTASTVGLVPATAALAGPLPATAAAVGTSARPRSVPDVAAGERQLRAGTLDALVTGTPAALRVVVKKNLPDSLRNALTVLARQAALNAQIVRAGGNPATVNAAVAGARVDVRTLLPTPRYQNQRLALGLIAGILIYLSLMIYGQGVAQGVVEEKSSRVVELLLTTLRPWQLMLGKVVGIGAVGLAQLLVVGVAGLTTAVVTGVLDLPSSIAVGVALWILVWYLLGFFMYALLFAAAGALVSRQEDVGGVTSPLLMLIILPYVYGVSVLPTNPDDSLGAMLSVFPLFAPMLMSMRIALGVAAGWQIALSAALSIALVVVLVVLAGRIYRNSVLRSGARVRLADALRGA